MTSTKLCIRLLGTPRIEINGYPLSNLPSRAGEALLIYLACTGRAHARDVLAELLWNDRDQKQGLANLRSTLSSLRRKAALKPFLHITRQTVALDEESDVWLDVTAFESSLRALEPRLREMPLTPETASDLESALGHYRGEFLEGFYLRSGRGFEEWAVLQRERLRRLAQRGLIRLAQHYLRVGRYEDGIKHAEKLLAVDSLDERAWRTMMLLLARSGRHNQALQQYEKLRQTLARELNLTPASETTALYERIRSAHGRPRHNLPPDATPFVGRRSELQRLHRDIHLPERRLVTILGPGGVGKTRLLLELARRLAHNAPGRFLHGIRYVSLAHLDNPQRLPVAIAEALDVTLSGVRARDALLDYLREKEILLLLDNFEHLLTLTSGGHQDGVDLVAAILREAPSVSMIVTSRERLQLQEEWVFDLSGLPAPPAGWTPDEENALGQTEGDYPAIDLFLQSAQRASRHFQPGTEDLRAIAAVCRRLEGLPLGIELAGGWVRQFSCSEILSRIEADVNFLTTAARNVPARHRSLRAVFEQSWQMLAPEERQVAASLSVFRDPFTARSAEEIVDAPPHILAALVDKSILRRAGSDARYDMHNLLQQLAAEQLAQMPDRRHAVMAAHAAYFAAFIEARTDAVKGGGQREAYREIGAVIDDVRAAWNWDLQQKTLSNIARSLEGLFYFYWSKGWLQEGTEMAARVIRAAQHEDETRLLVQAQMWLGEFYAWLGRYDDALEATMQAQTLCLRHDYLPELMFTYSCLGRIYTWSGDYNHALPAIKEGLDLARKLQDDHWLAIILNGLGIAVAEAQADYDEAWNLFEESLAISRRLQDDFGVARALLNMGSLLQEVEEYDEAQELYEQSLVIYRRIEYTYGIGAALNYLGQVTYLQGKLDQARTLIEEGYDLNREYGSRWAIVRSLTQLGNVARQSRVWREAQQRYNEALRLAQDIGATSEARSILIETALLANVAGHPRRALTLLAFILLQPDAGRERLDEARRYYKELSEWLEPHVLQQCLIEGASLTLDKAIDSVQGWVYPTRNA